jgi:hypothetical protein
MGICAQALWRARHIVLADKVKYDTVWESIIADPTERAMIAELGRVAREIITQATERPLQLNRGRASVPAAASSSLEGPSGRAFSIAGRLSMALSRAASVVSVETVGGGNPIWAHLLDCGVEGTTNAMQPVDSMDQLYCQAVALSPLLIAKVQAWAAASNGCFLSAAEYGSFSYANENRNCGDPSLPAGFVRWEKVREEEMLVGGRVRWARVKSVQRSIEKSTRSYGKVKKAAAFIEESLHRSFKPRFRSACRALH